MLLSYRKSMLLITNANDILLSTEDRCVDICCRKHCLIEVGSTLNNMPVHPPTLSQCEK